MVKAIGAMLLLIACTGIGFGIARNFRERPRHLQALMQTLRLLQADIEYGILPLAQALVRVSNRTAAPMNQLFRTAGEALNNDTVTVSAAFEEGIHRCQSSSALKPADYQVIREFADALSTVDRVHVQQQFQATLTQLHGLEQDARDGRRRNEKLWQYLGVCTGLLLILILY